MIADEPSSPKLVRRAITAANAAERRVSQLREAIIAGDVTVTGSDLAEAEADARAAVLRVEAVRRQVAEEAEAERQRRITAGAALRRRNLEQTLEADERCRQNAINDGTAARILGDLAASGSPAARRQLEEVSRPGRANNATRPT